VVSIVRTAIRSLLCGLCLAGCAASASRAAEAPDVTGVMSLLAGRGITIETNAAVEALARLADPRAEVREGARPAQAEGETIARFELWAENIRYLKLRHVATNTPDKVRAILTCASPTPRGGLLLDLRSAGGLAYEAVGALNGCLLGGTNELFTLQDLQGQTVQQHRAQGDLGRDPKEPLMVLVDDATQDAAELLAASLHGRKGVLLVGTRTCGDTGVRELIPLDGGRSLWIATRRIALSGGGTYDRTGVQPDIAIAPAVAIAASTNAPAEPEPPLRKESEKIKRDRKLMQSVAGDPCLRRATEILFAQIALDNTPAPAKP
jgi:C-terminal processing protease CtpA/Prc